MSSQIFEYALNDYWSKQTNQIITFEKLMYDYGSPGKVFQLDEKSLEEINYDPLKIAEKELDSGVLPISVNKPMPKRREEDIEKIKIEDSKITDAEKEKVELEEEKAIAESGEIMKLSSEEENSQEETLSSEKPSQEIEA